VDKLSFLPSVKKSITEGGGMKITHIYSWGLLCIVTPAKAMTMADLFAALKEQPVTTLDSLQASDSALGVQAVQDRFYSVVNGVMSSEKYNSPTSLRPRNSHRVCIFAGK